MHGVYVNNKALNEPYFTNDPIFGSCAWKRSSTRILGCKRNPTSQSQMKASPSSESNITMTLSKYLKQNGRGVKACADYDYTEEGWGS